MSCKDQIQDSLKRKMNNLKKLWVAYYSGEEEVEDLGTFYEYGLCFDYVPQGTFTDQKKAYFRYQISWGGPSEEFRFYVNPDLSVYKIEFWFLDWNDGASLELQGENYKLMVEIYTFFKDCGVCQAEYNKAMER